MIELESRPVTAAEAPARPRRTVDWRRWLPSRTPHQGPWGVAVGVLLILSALAVWVLLYAFVLSSLQESRAQSQLYARFRGELARETAPLGGAIATGDPVALLSVPRAHIRNQVIVEGTSSRQLIDGPGHLRTSVLPGQAGYSVLYGRSVTFGGPFGEIGSLRAGDQISVTTQQGRFTYTVLDVRHVGDRVPAAPAAGGGRLVLVSAAGHGALSGWAPDRQVFVDADLEGAAQPDPGGRVGAVSPQEGPLRGDTSRIALVAGALQILLIAVCGIVWLDARRPRPIVWMIGGPVLLGSLWLVSSVSAQLLPNLM